MAAEEGRTLQRQAEHLFTFLRQEEAREVGATRQ